MKLIPKKKYHVKWHDTISVEEWCNIETIEAKAEECAENQETVGFYVGDKNDYHIFAATINNAEGMLPYASVTFIPKGCVKKVTSF